MLSANLLNHGGQKHGPNVVDHHLNIASIPAQLTQFLEGGLGPDHKPAHVTPGGQLQQVQVVHLKI